MRLVKKGQFVTKMRKVFSAPIPEEKVGELVDYLVSVRGTEGK